VGPCTVAVHASLLECMSNSHFVLNRVRLFVHICPSDPRAEGGLRKVRRSGECPSDVCVCFTFGPNMGQVAAALMRQC